jgi:hypothetical protein
MELTVKLENNADVNFIMKVLLQLKGVMNVESNDENKNYSWSEAEESADFDSVLEQSGKDYREGKNEELNHELLNNIFKN